MSGSRRVGKCVWNMIKIPFFLILSSYINCYVQTGEDTMKSTKSCDHNKTPSIDVWLCLILMILFIKDYCMCSFRCFIMFYMLMIYIYLWTWFLIIKSYKSHLFGPMGNIHLRGKQRRTGWATSRRLVWSWHPGDMNKNGPGWRICWEDVWVPSSWEFRDFIDFCRTPLIGSSSFL